ncbi:MAG TPA: RidA family protein [Actinomycetota bacterium]|nr:RidA family protein [Actinomycetota bacterium]
MSETPHEIVNPPSLPRPSGFSHALVAASGRLVFLGGQAGHRADGSLVGPGLVEQFEQAASNVADALRAAGGAPEHLVQLLIFVTDISAYRDALKDVGEAYRRHFGRHFPPMALFGVTELFDPGAKVELVGVAVLP